VSESRYFERNAMKMPATNSQSLKGNPAGNQALMNQFYSVELSIRGLEIPYQFRLWNLASPVRFVLVKEYSKILPRLRVGDTLNMKYYPAGSVYRPESLRTAIRHVTKNDQGRFRGHYLVGLEIVERGNGVTRH
jgi:hypothetical protein